MVYIYQDKAKEKVKKWGYIPIILFCIGMFGATVITKDYALDALLINGFRGLVIILILWTIYISLWKLLYVRYWYPRDKQRYINYIKTIDSNFSFRLVGGKEINIEYKNMKLPTTWRRDQQIVEDISTAKQYIFTNHIANSDGKQTWWEDGNVVVCFNRVKEILQKNKG
jgi:hypothetical protein